MIHAKPGLIKFNASPRGVLLVLLKLGEGFGKQVLQTAHG